MFFSACKWRQNCPGKVKSYKRWDKPFKMPGVLTTVRLFTYVPFIQTNICNWVTQVMIHGKIEATILDQIPRQPWVNHFLSPNFDPLVLEPKFP